MDKVYPANSSITICRLSFSFRILSVLCEANAPKRAIVIKRKTWTAKDGFRRAKKITAAIVPKVPGAKGR